MGRVSESWRPLNSCTARTTAFSSLAFIRTHHQKCATKHAITSKSYTKGLCSPTGTRLTLRFLMVSSQSFHCAIAPIATSNGYPALFVLIGQQSIKPLFSL